MKYNQEDRVRILEYKFIFEEDIQIQKEYEEGSADLNYRLSFFRNQLENQEGTKEQQALYDKLFVGQIPVPKNNESVLANSESDDRELTESAPKNSSVEKPWVKKTYRQIAMITHPDRTLNIQSQHLRTQLVEQYRIAQNAYSHGLYSDLIMVAFDLNIAVSEGVVYEEIIPASKQKKQKINDKKNLLGWQWFHVPEAQRDAELKKILTSYGFKFTAKEVSKAIKSKYIKRKVGTRPVKMTKQRKSNNTSNKKA